MDGTQPGDPAKAARASVAVPASDDPPLRLALGGDAVEHIGAHLDQVRADLDKWAELSRSTALSGATHR
jgi:hypothetical protein